MGIQEKMLIFSALKRTCLNSIRFIRVLSEDLATRRNSCCEERAFTWFVLLIEGQKRCLENRDYVFSLCLQGAESLGK